MFIDEWKREGSKIAKKTFLHITKENPLEEIQIPFIQFYKARDFIIPINPFDYFRLKGKTPHERIDSYLKILISMIIQNNAGVVFFDPAPHLSNWNDESSAMFMMHLQETARRLKVIILVGRNRGKNHKDLEDDQQEKGSSTTWTDIPRIKLFFKECEIDSKLQRECKNKESGLVVYHTKNSYSLKAGNLYSKYIKENEKKIKVCYFKQVRELSHIDVENIDILSTKSAKQKLIDQIKEFIKENSGKAKLDDMYEGLEAKKDTIRATAYKCVKKGILSKDDKTGYYSLK